MSGCVCVCCVDLQVISDDVGQLPDEREGTLMATEVDLLCWETCTIAE